MRNLYKVRGFNGTRFVFAMNMAFAVEKYQAAEKDEYDEWMKENPDNLTQEELDAENGEFGLEPYHIELICSGSEIIGEPED